MITQMEKGLVDLEAQENKISQNDINKLLIQEIVFTHTLIKVVCIDYLGIKEEEYNKLFSKLDRQCFEQFPEDLNNILDNYIN